MSQQIVLDDKTHELLTKLAGEDGISPSEYISKMVEKDESDRHIVWSRKESTFIRVNCGSPNCKETTQRNLIDHAD